MIKFFKCKCCNKIDITNTEIKIIEDICETCNIYWKTNSRFTTLKDGRIEFCGPRGPIKNSCDICNSTGILKERRLYFLDNSQFSITLEDNDIEQFLEKSNKTYCFECKNTGKIKFTFGKKIKDVSYHSVQSLYRGIGGGKCGPTALSLVTKLEPKSVKYILEKHYNLTTNSGMYMHDIFNFIMHQGFNSHHCFDNFRGKYIKEFCEVKESGEYLILSHRHVSVVKDGELIDYASAKDCKIIEIYQITSTSTSLK